MSVASRPVGGFFELHVPEGAAPGPSVLDAWTAGRPWSAFGHARGAFAALVQAHPDATVWLPAFLCADMAAGGFAGRTRLYAVGEGFRPDLESVAASAAPGDLVLLVSYFGRSATDAIRGLAASRPDLWLVEDCAQALEPDADFAAHWRLFSPRKLLGVADGGLLVARSGDLPLPRPSGATDASVWTAPLLRFQDPWGCANAEWHAANQRREGSVQVDARAMTRLSKAILARTPYGPLAAARRRNAEVLDARLARYAAAPLGDAAPLGYVLRLPHDRRERLRTALQARRIFAAVHWPEIVGAPGDFPRENAWTRELLTLPCDHRYGAGDMRAIADAAEAALA